MTQKANKVLVFLLVSLLLASCEAPKAEKLPLDKTFNGKLFSFKYPSSFVPKTVEDTILLYRGEDVFVRFVVIAQKDKESQNNKGLLNPQIAGTDVTTTKKKVGGIEADWVEATDYTEKRAAILCSLPIQDKLVVAQTPSLLGLEGDYVQAKEIIESITLAKTSAATNVGQTQSVLLKLLPGFNRSIENKFFRMQVKKGWEADDYYQNSMAIIKKGFQTFTVIARPEAKVDEYLKSIKRSYKDAKDAKEDQSVVTIGDNRFVRISFKTEFSETTNLLLEQRWGLIQVVCGGEFVPEIEEMVATITVKLPQ